jgi:predicted peroxiredoxin/TusA-related sulfurtransferase
MTAVLLGGKETCMFQRLGITLLAVLTVLFHVEILSAETPMNTAHIIDTRGKKITTYILFQTVQSLKDMKEGETLDLLTEDYEAIGNDLQAWSRITGHRILNSERQGGGVLYRIQKHDSEAPKKRMALVISNDGLGELISPLGFALGAALNGQEVNIYFQADAVNVLKTGFKAKLHGMSRPFSSMARKGLNDMGHVPPQEKLSQLHELGAKFYVCQPSLERAGLSKRDIIFSDVILAEYMSFLEVMDQSDIRFYVQ